MGIGLVSFFVCLCSEVVMCVCVCVCVCVCARARVLASVRPQARSLQPAYIHTYPPSVSRCLCLCGRDNLTSRLRFEKHHQDHDHSHLDLSEAYLTPSQRKDLIIRELRAHVRQLNRQLDDKERQLEHLRRSREEEIEQVRDCVFSCYLSLPPPSHPRVRCDITVLVDWA